MFDRKLFAARLRARRGYLNLSQATVAEAVGVSPGAISQYETEDRAPSLDKIGPLCSALLIEPSELLASCFALGRNQGDAA